MAKTARLLTLGAPVHRSHFSEEHFSRSPEHFFKVLHYFDKENNKFFVLFQKTPEIKAGANTVQNSGTYGHSLQPCLSFR